ncbi:hypothetical protein [Flavobacterium agrisoli]|uniref:Uncharacterized protein n=1 Tax=Flavobacterium agrisoli TaxID=2793066 RepID=A0A934UIN7_9FLAO|nr:hypothetical protein [Flavobacterium agrisoli]MBK0369076.1 hypothetical protein [Flavobacterium agrisoli]
MRPNYSIDDLNIDIKLLELRQKQEWQELKDQIDLTKESLKPMHFIKKTLGNFKVNTQDKKDLFSTLFSIGTAYLTKKIVVGKTDSKVKRFFGNMLQLGLTNFLTKKTAVEN